MIPQDIWIQVKAIQVNFQKHLLQVIHGAFTCTTLGEIFCQAIQAVRRAGNDLPNSLVRRYSEYNLDLKGKCISLPQEKYQQAHLELWFYCYFGQKQKVGYKKLRKVIYKIDVKEVQEKE